MKNSKDFNQEANSDFKVSECKRIRKRIARKAEHLFTLESRLDDMLDNFDTDTGELYNISELIKSTRADILRLQSEQQKLGCRKERSPEISYDNQTIISTSSVRRKDSKALSRTPVTTVSFENQS